MNKILFRNYRIALTMALVSFALWAYGQATDSVTVKGTIPTHLIKVQEADGTQAHMGQMMGIVDFGDGDSLVSFLPVYFINDSLLVIGTDTLATRAYSRQNATESDPTVAAYAKTLTSASVVLSGLITVDGTGSGLDADLLDGQHGTYYLGIDSLDGVSNDGGNIDLVAGSNIIITPDDGANTITIAASGTLNGSGTLNYIPKFTPDGNTLGNSQIFANGTNVGISTTSPTSKLHVSGTGRITSTMQFDAYGNGVNTSGNPVNVLSTDALGVLQSHPVSEVLTNIIEPNTTNQATLRGNGFKWVENTTLRINGIGNVGINVVPETNRPLTIQDDTNPQLRIRTSDLAGRADFRVSTVGDLFLLPASSKVGIGSFSDNLQNTFSVTSIEDHQDSIGAIAIYSKAATAINNGEQVGTIDFRSADTDLATSVIAARVQAYAGGLHTSSAIPTGLKWFVTPQSSLVAGEVMRLTEGGMLGIGTTSPTEKLHVVGNVRFSGALMPNNAAGTSGQVLTSAGAGSPPTWTDKGPTGSSPGGANLIAYWTGASTLTSNSNLAYNGTNLTLGAGTLRIPDGNISLPALTFGLDTDNGLYRLGANNWGLSVNQTSALEMTATGATINNSAADFDLRVKGDTDADLIRADASTDRVGIGIASPTNKLHVWGGIELDNGTVTANEGTIRYSGVDLEGYIGGTWKSLTAGASGLQDEGNSGLGTVRMGSNDPQSVAIETSGTDVATFDTQGKATLSNSVAAATSANVLTLASSSLPTNNRDIQFTGSGSTISLIRNSYDGTAGHYNLEFFTANGTLNGSPGLTVKDDNNVQVANNLAIGSTDTDAELVIEDAAIANVAVRSTTDDLNTFWSLENEAQDNNSYAVYRDGLTENMIIARSVDQPFSTLSTTYVEFENGGDVRIHQKIQLGSSGNLFIFWGSGSPEGVVTAAIGSTYHRTDGGSGTSYYVKESGTGNTGWVAK